MSEERIKKLEEKVKELEEKFERMDSISFKGAEPKGQQRPQSGRQVGGEQSTTNI